jgi:hypothetical protein
MVTPFPRLLHPHCQPPQCSALLYRGLATSVTTGTLCAMPIDIFGNICINVFRGISMSENIRNYQKINIISYWIGIIFSITGITTLFIIIFGGKIINNSMLIDLDIGEKAGAFIAGFVGTCFGISGTAIIISTFLSQYIQNLKNQVENVFFKYIDLYYENINQINIKNYDKEKSGINETGRSAFISMKLQLYELLQLINKFNKKIDIDLPDDFVIDFAYMIFYYGFNYQWFKFIKDKFRGIDNIDNYLFQFSIEIDNVGNKKLGNTNQTFISSYMRNIYNAIKFIDTSNVLSIDEKKNYIRILRSQLSNPELYILYFNIRSRFGVKWIANDYIKKYQLFTNIPEDYCQEYDHKKYFPNVDGFSYEDDNMYNEFLKNIGIKNGHGT